jgi:GTPase SAR1 family protein
LKKKTIGTGESGKSTLVKQMKIIHQQGFTSDDLASYRPVVYSNTIQSLGSIIRGMYALDIKFDQAVASDRRHDVARVFEVLKHLRDTEPIHGELLAAMKRLWTDPAVQRCFKRSNEYQLIDSAQYFLDQLDRIGAADYLPNEQDVLRSRVVTTSIVEVNFELRDINFRLIDVGGQRSERRKWIHCFEGVNALLFVVALSEYDQSLYEDSATNRMQESLQLFDCILNSVWFENTATVLFMNKKDLFEEKLKRRPLTVCFPKYGGSRQPNDAAAYIRSKFVLRSHSISKEIYSHLTCATDTQNVQFVFDALADVVITINMRVLGLN